MSNKKPIELKVFVIDRKTTPFLNDGKNSFAVVRRWDFGLDPKSTGCIECGCELPEGNKKLTHMLASIDRSVDNNTKYMFISLSQEEIDSIKNGGITLVGPDNTNIKLTFKQ